MTDYIKIDWADVRAGDVLMHENGDRLTVEKVRNCGDFLLSCGLWASESWAEYGFTPHREAEPVPTEPGAYHDKDGVLCVLKPRAAHDPHPWMVLHEGAVPYWNTAESEDIAGRTPFTRLVPMPSSDAVMEVVKRAEPMCMRERITDAVMALLRGDGR